MDGATGTTIWNVFLGDAPEFGEEVETHGVAVGPDGHIIITGDDNSNSTLFAAKVDGTNGDLLWKRILGESGNGTDVGIDASGDPVVTGNPTVKFDGTTGEILWSLPAQAGALNQGRGIAFGPDGKFVITGESTVRFDGPVNNILWVTRAENLIFEEFYEAVAVGPDSNPVVIGNLGDLDNFQTNKYDAATGALLWSAEFDSGGFDQATGVAVGPDGNPIIAGISDADIRLVKYNGGTGSIIWNVVFEDGWTTSVAVGADGNPVIAGTCGSDFCVIKYNGMTGGILWNVTYDSGLDDEASSVVVGPDGHPVVVGTSSGDFRVIKYNGTDGSILWNETFDSGSPLGDRAFGVAIGNDGNPVVLGIAGLRSRTIKYDGTTGGVIWDSIYLGNSLQLLGNVAVGFDGNPIVTGSFGDSVLRLIRFDGATGALLSEIDFDSGDAEESASVAVGPDGNPVSVVTAYPAIECCNLWIIKYLIEAGTTTGSNVVVELNGGTQNINGIVVTYPQVTKNGGTTFYTSASGPPLPAGFSLGTPPVYYDISTTASFAPPANVCIAYDPARFTNPANVRLLHFENDAWLDVTISNNTTDYIICGQVSGFSPFAIVEPTGPPPNQPPVAMCRNVTRSADGNGQAAVTPEEVNNGSSDPDSDPLAFSVSPTGPYPFGNTIVTLTVTDDENASDTCMANISVIDTTPPTITPPPPITVNADADSCSATGVALGTPTVADNVAVASVTNNAPSAFPLGDTSVTWTVTDTSNNTNTATQLVTVVNPDPVATITGPPSGSIYAVGTPVNFTGTFTDAGGGPHTAVWMFDTISQAATVVEPVGSTPGSADTTYTFITSGVYLVNMTVNDNCGGTDTAMIVDGFDAMVVVYDQDSGFVTGGGWINSPAGAYIPDPTLTGKANFGFVSKYKNGASVPTGNTEFQFKGAGLNFRSTSYEWMVISGGKKAQYKGFGTINGSGNYRFMLTAIDGDQPGGDGLDKFRIRIWSDGGGLVYDNQLNAPDNSDPTTVLGGGSIVIHKQ
jgi:hypothetical protein